MPESPTANMLLILPTEGGDADTWDTYLNAAFGLVDAHDHSAGKGVLVPASGLKINADLAFAFGGTSYAATALKALDFTPTTAASITSYSSALFVNSSDSNNLYFRNAAGTNVKITDGSTINISIVGGIGGDYAAVGALLSYDDASDSYWLQQQGSPKPWARMRSGDLDIYETAASITNRVRLQSPSALAASYALTFPAALPVGVAAFRQVSPAGVETFSNTLATTLTANIFSATSPKTLLVPFSAAASVITVSSNGWDLDTSTSPVLYPLPIEGRHVIIGWTLFYNKASALGTISARLYKMNGTTGVITQIGATQSDSSASPGLDAFIVTGLANVVAANESFWIQAAGGGTTGDFLYGAEAYVTGG